MFQSRFDRISSLVDRYQQHSPTNTNSLIDNPTPSSQKVQTVRESLKTEIESFSIHIIDGLLDLTKTIDIKFVQKVNEYDPHFLGQELAKAITKYYPAVGFDAFFKMITEIKNTISDFYCCAALYTEIIFDGENHRNEACALLTAKLQEMTASEDFIKLKDEQILEVWKMIERLKPHARPIVKKNFYHVDLPMPKDAEENGQSYPIFSKTGNWSEHHLVMGALMGSFDEKKQQMKKVLKK